MKPSAPFGTAMLFLLALAGCNAMPSHDPSSNELPPSKPGYSNQVDHWPLVFNAHWFDAFTYSTYGCTVRYGPYSIKDPEDRLQAASPVPGTGHGYPETMRGGWGPIPNFPPRAVVDWRSADGSPHHAEIDIGEIFKDQLIRHNVPRDEVGKTYDPQPEIMLEVNDRTINVYMRATIYTRHEQIPGNKYSRMRDDLIKVFSRAY
ncbi:MAG TPA: hypothetical protein VGD42_17000 [Lysobacter sp.]